MTTSFKTPEMAKFYVLLTCVMLAICSCNRSGTKDSPVQIPTAELKKITVNGKITPYVITTEVYNGSNWTIKDIDVNITKKGDYAGRRFRLEDWSHVVTPREDGGERRTKKDQLYLKPYATSSFECWIGDYIEEVPKESNPEMEVVGMRGFIE